MREYSGAERLHGYSCNRNRFGVWLIEEIPTYSKPDDAAVLRVVGNEEIILGSNIGIHVTHHDKEAGVLEMEVSIDIHDGEIANFRTRITFLHGELSYGRTVIGSVVFGKIVCIGS